MLGHLVDLLQVGREQLAAMLLREPSQVILVIGVEDDVAAMPWRRHLDGGQVAQGVDGVRAVLGHAAVHIAKTVAATVDGQPRLTRKLRHAVVQETCPLPAFGLPVNAAVEAGRAVEARHVGARAQAHAEALARFAAHQIARCAAHSRRGDVLLQQRLVVAEAAGRQDDGALGVDVHLVVEILARHQAHDAPRIVAHERRGRALELVAHAVSLPEGEHGVGGVLHLQHVMVERGVLRRHVHGHLAQTPAHAAVGHPVQALAAFAGDLVDELRIGRVMVLVHGPIGQRLRVEGIAWEGEMLLVLAGIPAQDAAHARGLRVAAVQSQRFHANDVGAQLGRARGRVQPAAAGAYHAYVALVVPRFGNRARGDGRGVVRRECRGVVLAVRAVRTAGVGGGAVGHGDVLRSVGRPIADDALLHSQRSRGHGRRCRRAAHYGAGGADKAAARDAARFAIVPAHVLPFR